jgi:PAS domain S-box-containing protein
LDIRLRASGFNTLEIQQAGWYAGEKGGMSVIKKKTKTKAPDDVRAGEAGYRALFDKAPIGIAIADADARIKDANEMACRVLGYTKEELAALTVWDITHPDDRSAFTILWREVVEGRRAGYSIDKRYLRKDGSVIWISITTAPVAGPDGGFLYGIGMFEDISDRIRHEEDRRKAEAEIHRQRDELSHVVRVATMSELASSLAHEINQPLAAILSNAQAALRFLKAAKPDLEEIRDALKDIITDDQRAANVIKELRDLMKKEEPYLEPLDVSQIIEQVLLLLRSDCIIRGVTVINDLPADLPPVHGSRVQLQQVIINLINNACEAMKDTVPAEKMLTIRALKKDPENIAVEIADCGQGLIKGMSEKIFEPFFTTKSKGLGMGLAISRSIIAAHGGTLSARNNPDKGATVSFSLPIEGAKP